jgi:two-component system, LytTR family, response regulator
MRTYQRSTNENHLVLNKRTSVKVSIKDVVLLKGKVNYTIFHFKFGRTKMVAHTLKFFESFLEEQGFLRVHRSCIINPSFVKEYNRENQKLLMSNGELVSISRRRQKEFVTLGLCL